MRTVLVALLLTFSSQLSFGQSTILWKVRDGASDKTSYVVGTFHPFGNSFVDSIPEIRSSLERSELAVFESIESPEEANEAINSREASLEIESGLKKRDLEKLLEITKEWQVDLYKLEPVEVSWKLRREFQKVVCGTVTPTDEWAHFDNYLQHLATGMGVEVLGLESRSEQLALIEKEFGHPSWKKERGEIRFWMKQLTTASPDMKICEFTDQYRKLDLDYKFETECKDDVLIKDRSESWMKMLPDLMRSKACFVAVGLAHLWSKCGILERLRAEGFEVEPVELRARR